MAGKFDDMAGRLLLRFAVVLHRTVAGRDAAERLQGRRNRALRAAHRRGVPVEVLAARMRLTPSWIRQVLNGRKPPEVEEAA
ncbi:helix-turn-helix domain-containing protein [Streptomyces sp.]|uniref:helix-turn-helix domain-containing protein n=1 Tax=Streptomyces sp. TaxID=1931 RepID=UPI002F920C2C